MSPIPIHSTTLARACTLAGLLAAMPAAAQSGDSALEHLNLLGIGEQGQLSKYNFAKDELTSIGTIRSSQGTAFEGIDAAAYIPGHQNLIAFWTDPDTGLDRMVYINAETAEAAIVGQDLGQGHIAGATAAPVQLDPSAPAQWAVFALQNLGQQAEEPIDFDIVDDHVIPNEPFAAKVTVLGAAITYGGQYDMPVTARFEVNGQSYTPFGAFDNATSGNLNDGNNPRHYVFPNEFPAGTPIDVIARSWVGQSRRGKTTWSTYMTVDGSNTNSPQVKVLRNGDPVPNIEGFQNQSDVREFVRDYIDPVSNTVVLGLNEAIFLFELGTTDINSSAADFQDLVVLVTLARSVEQLEADSGDGDGGSQTVRYVVERSGSTVKFENAPVGLGENGAAQSDRFVIQVYGGGDRVTVTTKAGTGSATNTLDGVGDSVVDSLGFRVQLADIDDGAYTLLVTSVSNANALSHVEFNFGSGSWVTSPRDSYDAVRNGGDTSTQDGPKARLLRVDHTTGGYEQVMTLSRTYDSMATLDGRTFYAASGPDLFAINVDSQTETLLGDTANQDIHGLEFAGSTLMGFEIAGDTLVPLSVQDGQPLAGGMSLGLYDLGSFVFILNEDDPANKPDSYD